MQGFTAATGRAWQKHDLLSWYWCEDEPCKEVHRKDFDYHQQSKFYTGQKIRKNTPGPGHSGGATSVIYFDVTIMLMIVTCGSLVSVASETSKQSKYSIWSATRAFCEKQARSHLRGCCPASPAKHSCIKQHVHSHKT